MALGQPLPTLPLWIAADFSVPLDLEASYQATCTDLRIIRRPSENPPTLGELLRGVTDENLPVSGTPGRLLAKKTRDEQSWLLPFIV